MGRVFNSSISYPSPAPAISLTVTMTGHADQFGFAWTGTSYFSTSVGDTTRVDASNQDTFNFTDSIVMSADTSSYWQAYVRRDSPDPASIGGGFAFFTTSAMLASASAPTSSNITGSSATIACNYFPNTNQSTATVKMQYRRQGDVAWIDAGSADVVSGYSQRSISRSITGLACGTTYEFRLSMTRTTVNDTSLTSSISTFIASACVPVVTTLPATSIAPTQATLNGTVNPNGLSTTFGFVWGTTKGGPYPNRVSVGGPSSGTSSIGFSALITGLSPGGIYYFKAWANA